MVGTARGVGLWIAPPGTPGPSSIDTAFANPWRPLGYASDDGVTMGGDSSSESFTPWQSTTPIRTIVTEQSRTVNFTMWQLNEDTLGLYFDQTVAPPDSSGNFEIEVRSDAPSRLYAIGVDVADGQRRLRFIYPRASLESTGDLTLQRGAMVPLEVTLSALDDAGVMVHIYLGAGSSAYEAAAYEEPSSGTSTSTRKRAA